MCSDESHLLPPAVRPGPGKALSFDPSYTLDLEGLAGEGWSLWEIALRSDIRPAGPSRHPWKYIALTDFHEFATRTAQANDGPVLAVRVETSDWGYVAGITSDGHEAEALINSYSAADSSSDGWWAVKRIGRWDDSPAWYQGMAVGLASWARNSPLHPEPSEILEILRTRWVPAEKGLDRLCETLGLPWPSPSSPGAAFERAFSPWSAGVVRMRGRLVNVSKERFVLGEGYEADPPERMMIFLGRLGS